MRSITWIRVFGVTLATLGVSGSLTQHIESTVIATVFTLTYCWTILLVVVRYICLFGASYSRPKSNPERDAKIRSNAIKIQKTIRS